MSEEEWLDDSKPLGNVVTWLQGQRFTLAFKIQYIIDTGHDIIAVVPLQYVSSHTYNVTSEIIKALIIYKKHDTV